MAERPLPPGFVPGVGFTRLVPAEGIKPNPRDPNTSNPNPGSRGRPLNENEWKSQRQLDLEKQLTKKNK